MLIRVSFADLAPDNTSAARLCMYPNPEGGACPFALPELPVNRHAECSGAESKHLYCFVEMAN